MATKPPTASASPALSVSTSTLLEQAYDAFCVLEKAGQRPLPEEFVERFPTIKSTLGRLLELHDGFADEVGDDAAIDWPKVGDVYKGFHLQRKLGEGGRSRVYLATEPALGDREVALKFTRQGSSEAFILGKLQHPNVIGIHSQVDLPEKNLSFICMEYKGRATLNSLLNRVLESQRPPADASVILEAARNPEADGAPQAKPPRSWTAQSYETGVRTLFAQVCATLEYVHGQGICHRDLKPSNIVLKPDGTPVLLDFNLAFDKQSAAGRFGGTFAYMPPEQLQAMTGAGPPRAVNEKSDLFAVGVLLWQTLTGKLPFGPTPRVDDLNEKVDELLEKQRAGFDASIPTGWSVSSEIVALVRRCLAFDPAERPASAAELRRLLAPKTKSYGPWAFAAAVAAVVCVSSLAAATVSMSRGAAAPLNPASRGSVAERYQQGVKFFHAGDDDRARQAFKDVVSEQPQDPRGWWALAIAWVKDGSGNNKDKAREWAEAFSAAQTANNLEGNRGKKADFAFTAYLAQLRGDGKDARQQYNGALTEGQSLQAVHNNLAVLLINEPQNFPKAMNYLDQVLGADPDCRPALYNRALAAYKNATELWSPPVSAEGKQQLHKRSLADAVHAHNLALKAGRQPSGQLYYLIAQNMALLKPIDATYISHLTSALDNGVRPSTLNIDPAFRFVRNTPDFQVLAARNKVDVPDAENRLINPRTELPAWER